MSRYTTVDDLTGEVTKMIKFYSDSVNEELKDVVKEVAVDGRDRLKVEGGFKNRSGKYRKGWKVSYDEGRYSLTAIIHNKQYPLTHLLESGHAKWIHGRDTGEQVQGFPHIENVNREVQEKLEQELGRRLNDI